MKILLLIGITVLVVLTGCKTAEQTAYRGFGVTRTLVDTAMTAWGDYVRSGKATGADQVKVRALYEKYQAAMRVCRATVITLKTTPADDATWLRVITVLDASANDLVILIGKFVPTLQPRQL